MDKNVRSKNPLSNKTDKRLSVPILVDSAEAEVLRALRLQGQISRSEVSNITGWSKAKVSQEIRSVVEKRYLVKICEGASQGGRKPGLLKINDQLDYIEGDNELVKRGFLLSCDILKPFI